LWVALGVMLSCGTVRGVNSPQITGFTPVSGAPGTVVTIFGSGFAGTFAVTFNGQTADFSVTSPFQIATVVPLEADTGPLSVSTLSGTAISAGFFLVAPRISWFEPREGPPGTLVSVNGANFLGASKVEIGTNPVPNFLVLAATQIQLLVPDGISSGPIRVTTPAGSSVSAQNFILTGFAPTIEDFEPASGPPGTRVVVQGARFFGATAVTFNGTNAAAFEVVADSQLHAVVPAQATTGPIRVTTPSGTGVSVRSFNVLGPAPLITRFEPLSGPVGTRVFVEGVNLFGVTSVVFQESNAAPFEVTSTTQLQTVVPSGATTGVFRVTSPDGTGTSAVPFTVTSLAPVIASFTPAAGPPGTLVIITGEYFVGVTNVQFAGTTAPFEVTSTTQLQALVPQGATNGPIRVGSLYGAGTSRTNFQVITLAPIVRGFSPASGAQGTQVTVDGDYFVGVQSVAFGGLMTPFFEVTSFTQLQALVPANATSGPVAVTTPWGTGVSAELFYVPPRIGDFSPTNGYAGAPVTIRGVNFLGAKRVQFNGQDSVFVVDSNTVIRAVVPAAATTGPIAVSTPAGVTVSAESFTLVSAANLALAKSAFPDPPRAGSNFVYSLRVTNAGPDTATAAVVTDALPAGLDFVAATASQGTISRSNRVVTASLGALTNLGSALILITVTPRAGGTVTNTAAVTAAELDPDPADNMASRVTEIGREIGPTLQVRLEAGVVEISWLRPEATYVLERSVLLGAASDWKLVLEPIEPAGDLLVLRIPDPQGTAYYRLRKVPLP
jgi:uncharacterized repeat protein (TIGR01451 family)